MTWAVLAGGTAVFYALHGAWSTRVSRSVGPLLAGWALFSFACPFLFGYLVLTGVPTVGAGFWPAWGLSALINLAASYLFLSALRLGDLGLTYPLLALTPVFVIPLEWVLLDGRPGPWGFAGVALVVTGVYLLNIRERTAGVLAPMQALLRDPGAKRMLVVALMWSVGGTLDRVAVLASSPAFYSFMLAGGLALLYLPLAIRQGRGAGVMDRAGLLTRAARSGWWVLVVHGLLFSTMIVLQMEALSLALASYVLSIKRSGAIFAVILGYFAFREGALGPRLVGALVTVCGAGVLVFWG